MPHPVLVHKSPHCKMYFFKLVDCTANEFKRFTIFIYLFNYLLICLFTIDAIVLTINVNFQFSKQQSYKQNCTNSEENRQTENATSFDKNN